MALNDPATKLANKISDIVESKINKKTKKSSVIKTGKVIRIDSEGTPWVSISGSEQETPVNGELLSSVKIGDSVSINIENGKCNILGNMDDPSIGSNEAKNVSNQEIKIAVEQEGMIGRAIDVENNKTMNKIDGVVSDQIVPIEEAIEELNLETESDIQILKGKTSTSISMADSAREIADAANIAAEEAQAVAEATGQHFWNDDNGAHVTEVTQDEWNDPNSENYHSGFNSLFGSVGLLLRKALKNIAAYTQGNVAFYDGEGNASENITARFGASNAQIGKTDAPHLVLDDIGVFQKNEDDATVVSFGLAGDSVTNTQSGYDGTTEYEDIALSATSLPPSASSSYLAITGELELSNVDFPSVPPNGHTFTIGNFMVLHDAYYRDNYLWFDYLMADTYNCTVSGSWSSSHYGDYLDSVEITLEDDVEFTKGTSSTITATAVIPMSWGSDSEMGNLGFRAVFVYDGDDTIEYSIYLAKATSAQITAVSVYYERSYSWQLTTASATLSVGSPARQPGAYTASIGDGLSAVGNNQVVIGKHNFPDTPGADCEHAFIVGNGYSASRPSNAFSVDWNGGTNIGGNMRCDEAALNGLIITNELHPELPSDYSFWKNAAVISVTSWPSLCFDMYDDAGIPTYRFYMSKSGGIARQTFDTGTESWSDTRTFALSPVAIANGGTGQTSANAAARALGMAKTAGDSITMSGIIVNGYLTNAKKSAYMTVPLPYRLYGVNSTTVSGTVTVRGSGLYLFGSTSDAPRNLSALSPAVTAYAGGFVRIAWTGSEQSSATNNSPISVNFNTLTITFH